MINKNGKDVPVSELTAETYLVPKGEEKLYHCIIEVVQYDPKTGKKLSVPRVQKFGRKTFETLVHKTLKKQGYEVKILHTPVSEATAAAAKAKAEQAKFSKAVAEAVDAALAKKESEAADKDAEIAKLKAELAKIKKAEKASKTNSKDNAGE